uniref:Segmentation protein cap'n'collar n=2 Tax=Panagrellus redivivus TaxID=6233 RepID=A0A7E4ZZY0_PANRE
MSDIPPKHPPALNEGWELDSNFDVQEYLTDETDALQPVDDIFEGNVPMCHGNWSPASSHGDVGGASDVDMESRSSWSDLSHPRSDESDTDLAMVSYGAPYVVPPGNEVPAQDAVSLILKEAVGGKLMATYFLKKEMAPNVAADYLEGPPDSI